jgi:hypothetical protein
MVHVFLQFTLRIAFRCVLHRCASQDIRCSELSWFLSLALSHSQVFYWFGLVLVVNKTEPDNQLGWKPRPQASQKLIRLAQPTEVEANKQVHRCGL